MHLFSYVAFVHVLKEARTKLDSKGVKCIFVDYCKKIKGYRLYNPKFQYVIISRDVIFDESINFDKETMVSRLDYGLRQMILNQKLKTKDESIFEQMKENPTMIGKYVYLSCVFFSVNVDEPHFFVKALNGENSQH